MSDKQKEAQQLRREKETWQKKAKDLMSLEPDERQEQVRRHRGTSYRKLMVALGEIEEE